MNALSITVLLLGWLVLLGLCWFGWQVLRQNGRLVLRLEELENRLNEIEFGGGEEQAGLPVGTEALAFELADLAGKRQSLAQYQGRPLLLIFFNPDCGYCREMAPKLAAEAAGFQPAVEGGILPPGHATTKGESRSTPHDPSSSATDSTGLRSPAHRQAGSLPLQIVIVTAGDAEKNRQFFNEQKVGCPVLLQNDCEVAKSYQAHGTPTGYLISADGKIASPRAMGADAVLALASGTQPSTLNSPPALNGNGDDRASRFGKRSLARSKLERDGLKAGTLAPDFRLPLLDGNGDLSLSQLRGKRVLLVFSSPDCGPCAALAPHLEKFHREQARRVTSFVQAAGEFLPNGAPRTARLTGATTVVMISKDDPKENRAKLKEHGLTFPIVLQQQWEVSRRYAMFATPIAYLIDEQGVIAENVAVGAEAILALMSDKKS